MLQIRWVKEPLDKNKKYVIAKLDAIQPGTPKRIVESNYDALRKFYANSIPTKLSKDAIRRLLGAEFYNATSIDKLQKMMKSTHFKQRYDQFDITLTIQSLLHNKPNYPVFIKGTFGTQLLFGHENILGAMILNMDVKALIVKVDW
jgi:hypothetical protein